MKLLDLTLPTPEANLALDEALLETAEQQDQPLEVLRLWESPQSLVVVGRSSRVTAEVSVERCRRLGLPILRRCSGGASIVAGPGCLMYAVVLSYQRRPPLRWIDEAHRLVLSNLQQAVGWQLPEVEFLGTSDLAWRGQKFSGNSLRCKRQHLLYHGTLLYDFPLHLIGDCLAMPPRQPDYRAGRGHDEFVANLPLKGGQLRQALTKVWEAGDVLNDWPRQLTAQLADEKYRSDAWNLAR